MTSNKKITLESAKCLMNSQLKKHGLSQKGWKAKFFTGKRRAGKCDYGKKEISISKYILDVATLEQINNTILHEVAHALVGYKAGHGPLWKEKALEIGCDGSRTHSLELAPPSFFMTCENNCFSSPRHRKVSIMGKVCCKCKSQILLLKNS